MGALYRVGWFAALIGIGALGHGYLSTFGQSGQTAPKETVAERNGRLVVAVTNAERRKAGLPAFREQAQLTAAAMKHAEDMAQNNYFDHRDQEGGMPWDRVRAEGYKYRACAENIAFGQKSPQRVVAGWMTSPGHRKNILGNFAEIGVGFARSGKKGERRYWVQVFGTPKTTSR
jgi:uncharacterized protein YkwD